MTRRDEVIRMAREAAQGEPIIGKLCNELIAKAWAPFFERFAALVSAAERERCAKECDKQFWLITRRYGSSEGVGAGLCAEAIRAISDAVRCAE